MYARIKCSVLLFAVLFSGAALADQEGLRQRLINSKEVLSLYSIDDFSTLVVFKEGDASGELKAACDTEGSQIETTKEGAQGQELTCKNNFTARSVEGTRGINGKPFIIRHTLPQPLAYKSKAIPAIEQLAWPKAGELTANYSGMEFYEFALALCKKNNGVPDFVVPKQYGKYIRFTQVPAAEAFEYFISEETRKDAWFLACNGEKRFVVENYLYTEGTDNKFYFYPNRGLEGVNYMKMDKNLKKSPVSKDIASN